MNTTTKIINGKKPLSTKAKQPRIGLDDIFGNQLGLDPEIVKACEEMRMAYRWINAKRLGDMGGYHQRGWRPVKLKELQEHGKMNTQSLLFGQDPDGYIRRGDNILAIRDIEKHKQHRRYLDEEAARMSLSKKSKAQAEELKDYVSRAGLDVGVLEGFENEDE